MARSRKDRNFDARNQNLANLQSLTMPKRSFFRRLSRLLWIVVVLSAWLPSVAARSDDDTIADDTFIKPGTDNESFVHTTIKGDVEVSNSTKPSQVSGKYRRIFYLAMRKTGTTGRLPVAFVYLAKPEIRGPLPSNMYINAYGQMKDLALRGYLAISVQAMAGGRSDAFTFAQNKCVPDLINDAVTSDADYLQAVINSVIQEPAADPSRIIVVANGTAAIATLKLSTRRINGLRAIVNVSGGFHVEDHRTRRS
jgi:hypothetical protein